MAVSDEDRGDALGAGRAPARPSSPARPTSRPSSRTPRAARPASTCPATRAARAPTRACAPRSAGPRWAPTSRRTSRASTSGRSRRPTSGRSCWPPRRTAPRARSSSPTAPRRATTRSASRSRRSARPLVVQRNSHASVIDGLVLSGGKPTFVAPEYEEELGMAHGVTPESLAAALERDAGRDAPRSSSRPTYYGMSADVEGCAAVCHAAGVPLVVDQAWGPHFGFHPELPPSALMLGADAMITSTHKIVGSLTQSAMLHVAGRPAAIDPDAVARTVRLDALDVAVRAADGLARRRAAPARAARRGAAERHDRGLAPRARGDRRRRGRRA